GQPWLKDTVSDQELVTYRRYGVTSDATHCSRLGAQVISEHNGNAMDAAVTTVLCVGVTNFHSNGIGGGSFLMHYNSTTKAVTAYNYREVAPRQATPNMFDNLPNSQIRKIAIAVPGEVAGLHRAHSRHGRLRWSDLVKRVADLLRSGVEVTKPLVQAIPSVNSVKESALYKAVRNPATGAFYAAGETFTDEKLARTFDTIANDPMSFYNGQLADDIVKEISEAGGKVTKEDLRQYNVAEPDPISVELDESGLRLYSMPPPSGGAVLGFILNVLDGYRMGPTVKDKLDSYATFHHRMIEAIKFGYAKKSYLGDDGTENMAVLVANLTSKLLAAETRSKIFDNATQDVEYYGPSYKQFTDSGTTHVSLVDSEGNAVVVTSSINNYFGSLNKGSKTGILRVYNNQMEDFSWRNKRDKNNNPIPTSAANYIKPGKRPMSSAAPVFITEQSSDQLRYIGGAAGGSLITSALTSVLARLIYLKQNVKEATDAFRLHHELSPNDIQYWNKSNSEAEKTVLEELKKRGHSVTSTTSKSVVEIMQRLPDGSWQTSGDYRKAAETAGN
uniref:Gamma-glutamyltranspeptidase 1 n=1 Tax=Macrostomum lignano TaxID=282301 RepID=A0A1I8GKS6_9PLAT